MLLLSFLLLSSSSSFLLLSLLRLLFCIILLYIVIIYICVCVSCWSRPPTATCSVRQVQVQSRWPQRIDLQRCSLGGEKRWCPLVNHGKTIGKWWFNGILMGCYWDFNGINGTYPLVICDSLRLKMAMEIVDWPIENGDFPIVMGQFTRG